MKDSIEQLVKDCQQGDEVAWRKLMDTLTPVIFSICRQSGLSNHECFDVYGQVSYELATKISQVNSPNKIISYVAITTRRKILNYFRSLKYIKYLDFDKLDLYPDYSSNNPDKELEIRKRNEIICEALKELSKKEKKLLNALFFEGTKPNYKKVAKKLGVPESSIGPMRARSLSKLKKILNQKIKKI
ncbi:MAG: sigma-70 family RNA polymerase sigma factor [Candidatus Hodarchaeales archaeon]